MTQEATIVTFRIVCAVKGPSGHANPKEHVVAVGVGDDASTAAPWTVDAVLAAMDLADIFYTQGTTSGKVALVQEYACTHCRRVYIRSAADAVTGNDLDSLQRCPR